MRECESVVRIWPIHFSGPILRICVRVYTQQQQHGRERPARYM